jgi:hypothetical protein
MTIGNQFSITYHGSGFTLVLRDIRDSLTLAQQTTCTAQDESKYQQGYTTPGYALQIYP